MAQIPNLLNALPMPFGHHGAYNAPIVLVGSFFDVAPLDTFPNRSNIERLELLVIFTNQLYVSRLTQ